MMVRGEIITFAVYVDLTHCGNAMNRVGWCSLALIGVMGLPAGGCGDRATPRTTDAQTTARRNVTRSARLPKTDRQLLRAALFRQRDLSSDWVKAPPIRTRQRCLASPFRVASASSTTRFSAGQAELQQLAALYPSSKEATEAFRQLKAAQEVSCFRKAIAAALRSRNGGKLTQPLTNLRVEELGPAQRAIRMTAAVESITGATNVYIDHIQKRVGRGISVLAIINAMTPIDEASYDAALGTFTKRVNEMGSHAVSG
jgi:hypothetical protein